MRSLWPTDVFWANTKMSVADDTGSDLEGFIVDDKEAQRELKRARLNDDDDAEGIKALAEEAERFAGSIEGTVVGGRVLRSRAPEKIEARRPKDAYMERFGRAVEERLMEKLTKKDICEYVEGPLKKDFKEAFEATGRTWPVLNTKMTLEAIREKYAEIKVFAELPDSDDETEDTEVDSSDEDGPEDAEDDEDDDAEDDDADEDAEDAEDK